MALRQRHLSLSRDEGQYAGVEKEVKNAREEGANFEFNVQPVELVRWIRTGASAVFAAYAAWRIPDGRGRRRRYLYRTASSK